MILCFVVLFLFPTIYKRHRCSSDVLLASTLTCYFALESVVALWVTGLIAALASLLVGVGVGVGVSVAEKIAALFERKSLELPAIAANTNNQAPGTTEQHHRHVYYILASIKEKFPFLR